MWPRAVMKRSSKRAKQAPVQGTRRFFEDASRQIAFGAQSEQQVQQVRTHVDQNRDRLRTSCAHLFGGKRQVEGGIVDHRCHRDEEGFVRGVKRCGRFLAHQADGAPTANRRRQLALSRVEYVVGTHT